MSLAAAPSPACRFRRRATALLMAACRGSGARTVLVPALYCPGVVTDLWRTGLRVRYYDVTGELVGSTAALDRAVSPDSVVIWHQPFGFYGPVPRYPGVLTVEDACFSLRTFLARGMAWSDTELCVTSLRTEFGLSVGGLTFGRKVSRLPEMSAPDDPDVLADWRHLDIHQWMRNGQRMTACLRVALADRLPWSRHPVEVLSELPLLSSRRDRIVATLRNQGVQAWYWQERVPGLDRRSAPIAWDLWRRLFLVRLPCEEGAQWALAETVHELGTDFWRV